jgi:CheY-like chemotaxis protein
MSEPISDEQYSAVTDRDQREICAYLACWREKWISQAEICRRAGGKRRFQEDSRWAIALLPRLVEKGLIESDANGHFRLRPVPARGETDRNDAANLFYRQGLARVKQLHSQFQAVRHPGRHATVHALRQHLLGELSAAVCSLAEEAQRAALNSTHRLGSALEGLLRKLHQRGDYCTSTALDAVGGALDLLEELCRLGVEPDLAATPLRVLVVDDDLIARRAFARALQVGFDRPDNAPNGEAALALASEKPFDVILLDMHMPGMDGSTTCEKIHQTPANHETPIVFVTGQDDREARSHAARSGGRGFIPKPVLASEITLTALTLALRRRLSQPGSARSGRTNVASGRRS